MKVHPIQINYKRTGSTQGCELCGAVEEPHTATAQAHADAANLSEIAQWNSMHLVHLVKAHLADVQASVSATGRSKEINVTEPDVRKKVTAG